MITDKMNELLSGWWAGRGGNADFYREMQKLIEQQEEQIHTLNLKLVVISIKLETLIQEIKNGKRNQGTEPPISH